MYISIEELSERCVSIIQGHHHLKAISKHLFFCVFFFVPLCQQGAGTDEHALIEILVTRSNEEIQAMNAAYQAGEFETKTGLWSTSSFYEGHDML